MSFPLSLYRHDTAYNNYFVPTTVKEAGRKWIPLKLTHRLSAHVFQSHQMFSALQYKTSTGKHVHPADSLLS